MGASSRKFWTRGLVIACAVVVATGCGRGGNIFSGGDAPAGAAAEERDESLFDLFTNQDDPNVTVAVNKYLWNASLEVLNFLPIQSADSFSGLIVTGFGTPPGGGRAYRATILVRDPALDARSLSVSLATRGGPASVETVRAVEDAILTRARQLRQRDLDL